MYDLGTLDGGKDSEAHAISDDGRIIYGVATNERNNWRQVIWRMMKSMINISILNNKKLQMKKISKLSKKRLSKKSGARAPSQTAS